MKNLFRLCLIAAVCLPLVLVDGCGPFWVDPYITVKDSPLNWVEIHYYNMKRQPYRKIAVYLSGAGYAEVKKGTSDLVSNDFAKRYADDTWNDVVSFRRPVDEAHLRAIFQNLVNFGLLDREKWGKRSSKSTFNRFIAVKANISSYTYSEQENIYEVDPDLADQLYDVIREFDDPTR